MTMPALNHSFVDLLRRRRLPWLVLGFILAVFGLAIGQVTQRMRAETRRQMVDRDGELLHAIVMMQIAEVAADLETEVRDAPDLALVLLKATRLRGVIAARLFDTNGVFLASFPLDVIDGAVDDATRERVLGSHPVSSYRGRARRSDVFLELPGDALAGDGLPLLEACVPLQTRPGEEVVGIAQFVIEGETLARGFAALDRNLLTQAVILFGAGAVIIGGCVGWTYQRWRRTHRQLAGRTRDLLRANEELALAARTSAIGSVAAHLIHGLKNPLSGLQQFVNGQTVTLTAGGERSSWQDAVATTRRMQQMVADVVRVLREDRQEAAYLVRLAELAAEVRRQCESLARSAGVSVNVQVEASGEFDNRQSNLLGLILTNLVQNAIQASPRNGRVTLSVRQNEAAMAFRVEDQGPGLPPEICANLFAPCQSTREGGTGIGLVISKQLANHLGADLRLERTSAAGCVFLLELPLVRSTGKSPLADSPVQA